MAAATSQRPVGAQMHRVTKEGRKLKYALSVIQQPERARACGSGAKSSADRRPVDPPPVVELRIFEGEDGKEEDVTFSYNANFFLFATLETARPIANGRVHPSPPQIPVLTGMPVSGMAYLDRPSEAGYFIFPDLSVRHEGKYYLSFNLYEETKEAKDGDAEPANGEKKPKGPGIPGAPDSSFDWRLEVKSAMFTVFSAKKFPGLAESTPLSRTVAEQGCRVRIRRDVRMRRRDKAPSEYEDQADDGYARPGRAPEQSHDPYREHRDRSNSPGNDDGREPQRGMSGDYPPQYNQYAHAPPAPQGYSAFGNGPGPQYQAPQPQYSQPPPPPPPAPHSYQSAPSQYHHTPAPQYQPRNAPAQQGVYPHERPYPQSAYPANPPRDQHQETYESDSYRRASAGFPAPNPHQSNPYPAAESSLSRPSYSGFARPQSPPHPGPVNLAPLKMPPYERKYENTLASPAGPLSSANRLAPPMLSPAAYDRPQERTGSYSQYSSAPIPAAPEPTPTPMRNGKRTYDSVFSPYPSNQPLYNGMRPSSSHHDSGAYDDDDDAAALQQMKMEYKRADGETRTRPAPIIQ